MPTQLDLQRAQAIVTQIAADHPEFSSREVVMAAATELGCGPDDHKTIASLLGVRIKRTPEEVAADAEISYIKAARDLLRARLLLAAHAYMNKPQERMVRAAIAAGFWDVAFSHAFQVLTPEQWSALVNLPPTGLQVAAPGDGG